MHRAVSHCTELRWRWRAIAQSCEPLHRPASHWTLQLNSAIPNHRALQDQITQLCKTPPQSSARTKLCKTLPQSAARPGLCKTKPQSCARPNNRVLEDSYHRALQTIELCKTLPQSSERPNHRALHRALQDQTTELYKTKPQSSV